MLSRAWNFHRFQREAHARLAALAQPGDILVAMTDPPLLGAHLAPLAGRDFRISARVNF